LPPRRFRRAVSRSETKGTKKSGFPVCLQNSLPAWDYRSLPHCLIASPQEVASYRARTILSAVQDEEEFDEEEFRARVSRLVELMEDALELLDHYDTLVLALSELDFPENMQRQHARLATAWRILAQEFHSIRQLYERER
jgi:hypothetical protein